MRVIVKRKEKKRKESSKESREMVSHNQALIKREKEQRQDEQRFTDTDTKTYLFLFTKVFSTVWGTAALAFVYLVANDNGRSFVIAAPEDLPPLCVCVCVGMLC